jgi:AmmeMemoRadiSam system protein B/AmmeMemoRadiSam system protein A
MEPMKRIRILTAAAIVVFALYTVFTIGGNSKSSEIRSPAVSGSFYPADSQKLKLAVQEFLQDSPELSLKKPIALIVPHAGWIYSGQICADAFRQAKGHSYDVIVILGTNHTAAGFKGVSFGDYGEFRTPLGDISVDEDIIRELVDECDGCGRSSAVHVREHSIEVQLPFIQEIFPKAKIVPVIIHPPDYSLCIRFGRALGKVLKNRRALIVISSDLSHYPDSENARRIDRRTLETIAELEPARFASLMRELDAPGLDTRACGEAPILAGMTAAIALGAKRAVIAGYANSGDALIGDRDRTVGYGAAVLTAGSAPSDTRNLDRPPTPLKATSLSDAEKKALLKFARESILRYLTTRTVPLARNFPARMEYPQGAFVTLKKSGELRGCIGHIPPHAALGWTVGAMALQAAFNDPRFAPVGLEELEDLEIEISVLTPMKPVASFEEILVGRDGVLMSKSGASAVFLPQVAVENGWDRNEMLDNLCKKAEMPAACWKSGARFHVFQAEVFNEHQF